MIARRRLLALPALLGLPMISGCGWEPLYANPQTDTMSADLRAIKVEPIAERVGQMLEFGLRESLNPSHIETPTRYSLRVGLQVVQASLGIQSQGLGTRGEVIINANYQLFELPSTKQLQAGSFHANDTWDIQANGYSTVVAQHDAERRCIEELRYEIIARLSLFLQNRPATPS